jgi:hypothetical protein
VAVAPDKFTAVNAGFGALLGVKEVPAETAVVLLVGAEAIAQISARSSPGSMGPGGPSEFGKSVLDVAVALASWWLVSQSVKG